MKLSVIIVNFNTAQLLKDCLTSLQESIKVSKIGKMTEVIVVDNGSQDKSVAMLKRGFPAIDLIENRTNKGFSCANNQAVKRASGQYLLFLNSDILVKGDILRKLTAYLEQNQKCGVVTPRLVLTNGELDIDCHRGFPTPWAAFCYFAGLEKIFPKSRLFGLYHQLFLPMDKVHQIDSCCGAFMMVRKKTGDDIGWWNEEYFFYGEDLDFCYRAKEKKWQIIFFPEVSAFHYKGASSGLRKETADRKVNKETRIKAAEESVQAMEIFYQTHYRHLYPKWVTFLVMTAIKSKGVLRILSHKLQK